MIELIGWAGGVMLAVCSLPAAFQAIKRGNADGYDLLFLNLWFWGEVLALIYVYATNPNALPLLFNYALNIVGLLVIFKYRLWKRAES